MERLALADALEQRAVFLFEAALNRDVNEFPDVLLNVQECAAVASVDRRDLLELIRRGTLTPVGQIDDEDYFILLSDVMRFLDRVDERDKELNYEWNTAYGQVRQIRDGSFLGEVSTSWDRPGDLVEFSLDSLDPEDGRRLRVGARFVFKSRSLPAGPEEHAQSWTVRPLPRPVLTEEQVSESYRWADSFLQDYVSGRMILDLD